MMNDPTRFGLLTVLGMDAANRRYRLCRCDCGTKKKVRIDHLRGGLVISCGCERSRRSSQRASLMHKANVTHGASDSRAYSVWHSMRSRCGNPNNPAYASYGGRGISVCAHWDNSFAAFLADMGQPGPKQEIDRKDNDGNYEPGNCRWASRKEQQLNRRCVRRVLIDGVEYKAAELAERAGLKADTIIERTKQGLSLECVLSPERRVFRAGLALGGIANGARQRALTHCKNGHPYTRENTAVTAQGWRRCKACRRAK